MKQLHHYLILTSLITQIFFSLCNSSPLIAIDSNTRLSQDRLLQTIQHTLHNQEQEIAAIHERIQNQETILESMREEVTALLQATKEAQKTNASSQESRLKAMEKKQETLLQDLKQFKTHANESSSYSQELQKKIRELNDIIRLQGEQVHELEEALRSLALAIQGKPSQEKKSVSKDSQNSYQVKSGDTLEKIAKEYKVTIQALKVANGLQKDKIVPGQELKIP